MKTTRPIDPRVPGFSFKYMKLFIILRSQTRAGPVLASAARASKASEASMEKVGTIEYEWVGPRYIRSWSRGELQEDETLAFMEVITERFMGEPYFLWEVDVVEFTGMVAEARRAVADHLRRLPDRAIAVVGGKFSQKILVKLVLTAVAMLDRSQRNNQVQFFSDSDSARRWLEEYAKNHKPLGSKG